MLDIKCGTNIGRRSVISVSNKIVIGEKVLIAPNVYITDHGHEFNDINIPIMDQGINTISNRVKIGDGTWIGINSSIIGNVSIGKNCVIGANSFVNTNIPDYSVAVGSPAKIIKMFNFISNKWEIIRKDSDVQEILKNREVLKD
ncbi:acyltransferase [Clostridium sp. CH2]|nr:acyltransferase [Clostridium sp. CH2]